MKVNNEFASPEVIEVLFYTENGERWSPPTLQTVSHSPHDSNLGEHKLEKILPTIM